MNSLRCLVQLDAQLPPSFAERCAPLILSALRARGIRQRVAVHRVIAILMDARTPAGFDAMTWSDLVALAVEAFALSNLDVRQNEARARRYGLGRAYGFPVISGAAVYAVADDTLADLLARERTDEHTDPQE